MVKYELQNRIYILDCYANYASENPGKKAKNKESIRRSTILSFTNDIECCNKLKPSGSNTSSPWTLDFEMAY